MLFLSFAHTLRAVRPAQLPDSPAVWTLLHHLSSLLCSFTRFFSGLLRRPPPAARPRRWDFFPQLPAWPASRLSPEPRRLLLLLAASMALPGRPPRSRHLKLTSPNPESREEDPCSGRSSPECVSTGDASKPILGLPQPQAFPPVLTRLTQPSPHNAEHTGLPDTPTSAEAVEATFSQAIHSLYTVPRSGRKPSDASEDLFQLWLQLLPPASLTEHPSASPPPVVELALPLLCPLCRRGRK